MGSIARSVATLSISLLLLQNAWAETSKTFNFENQKEEIFDLENWLKKIEYKKEERDTTCYRQEPYVENVCRNVTRYRQECHIEPSHEECRSVYDQQCRTEYGYENVCHTERGGEDCRVVVNYREECSTSGGGLECRTIPGDIECSIVDGENRCVKIPPREECSSAPERRDCRQVPYEERECSQGPSREVCEQVYRPHEVCESVPRQQCSTVPAENVCENVPYYEEVCADETLYRSVPYACRKEVDVPYETILKTYKANVQVLFDSKATEAASELTIALNDKGELALSGKELEGNTALLFAKKDVKAETHADVTSLKGVFNIQLIDKKDLFDVSSKGISDVDLGKRTLSFIVHGKFAHKNSSLAVKIAKKNDVKFEKTLKASQFTAKYDGSKTFVEVNLEAVGAPKLGGLFNKTHQVSLKLNVDAGGLGQLLFGEDLSAQTSVEVKAD